MPRNTSLRIQDILDAVAKIQVYLEDIDLEEFESDSMRQDAVIRNFEIIGEAATNIPEDLQQQYPNVPWAVMKRMRNFLIHVYHAIKLSVIWETATQDLAPLIPELPAILKDIPNTQSPLE